METVKHSVRFKTTMLADSPLSDPASPEDLHDLDSEIITAVGYVEPKYQSLTEKGIRLLCSELLELKKASAEEMRKNVFANYTAFIRTAQELGELEVELTTMQSLITTHADLVQDLLEGVHLQSNTNTSGLVDSSNPSTEERVGKITELENQLHALSDAFDVCMAECRMHDAASTLEEAEAMLFDAQRIGLEPSMSAHFGATFSEGKARLIAQLARALWDSTVYGHELRMIASLLLKLGEGSHAHTLLLRLYHSHIQRAVKSLHPTASWYVGTYVTNLAQLYFSMMLRASQDSLKIFGSEPAFASELFLWVCKEAEEYSSIVQKYITSFSIGASGIGAVAEALHISLGYGNLLERTGYSLCPLILKTFKPCVKGVLEKCFRRVHEGIIVYCASDNWLLREESVLFAIEGPRKAEASPSRAKLSASGHKLFLAVQGLLENATLISLTQFGRLVQEGVLNIFSSYVKLLIRALPRRVNEGQDSRHLDDNVKLFAAESEAQQLSILSNAAALADELFPKLAMKYQESVRNEFPTPTEPRTVGTVLLEPKEWRKILQRSVDELRDTICEHHVLELLFDENEKPLLTADLYLRLDDDEKLPLWLKDPMPSGPFQAFLKKFHGLERLAREIFVGRERAVPMLFMRLSEAFVMRLAKHEYFWRHIEDTSQTLGPLGLQQFVFDMQFVVHVASAGRYASRKMLQIISSMVSRAEEAFSASGLDPKSVVPEDEWFEDKAKSVLEIMVVELENSLAVNGEVEETMVVEPEALGEEVESL